jgi:hypothetical protein
MKCTNCKQEMAKGFLSCSGFAPAPIVNKKIFWCGTEGTKKKLELGDKLEAFICEKCRKISLEY